MYTSTVDRRRYVEQRRRSCRRSTCNRGRPREFSNPRCFANNSETIKWKRILITATETLSKVRTQSLFLTCTRIMTLMYPVIIIYMIFSFPIHNYNDNKRKNYFRTVSVVVLFFISIATSNNYYFLTQLSRVNLFREIEIRRLGDDFLIFRFILYKIKKTDL